MPTVSDTGTAAPAPAGGGALPPDPVDPAVAPGAPPTRPAPRSGRRGRLGYVAAATVALVVVVLALVLPQGGAGQDGTGQDGTGSGGTGRGEAGPSLAGEPVPSEGGAEAVAPLPEPRDLGLAQPVTVPPCDGSYAVFLGAATVPSRHAEDVQQLISENPGARYLHSVRGCPSLRERGEGGGAFYAVYLGPFATLPEACAARAAAGEQAYLRRLDTTSEPGVDVLC